MASFMGTNGEEATEWRDSVHKAVQRAMQVVTSTNAAPQEAHCAAADITGRSSAPLCGCTKEDFSQLDAEGLRTTFSPASMQGIRSLPNALHPDFRMHLYGSLVQLAKARRQGLGTQSNTMAAEAGFQTVKRVEDSAFVQGKLSCSVKGPNLQTPVAQGQTAPGAYSALNHYFSIFEHQHSDFDAENVSNAELHDLAKSLRLAEQDFVVTAMPPVPKGATFFDEFSYLEDPYELQCNMKRLDDIKAVQQRIAGRYVPGGKAHALELSKASLVGLLLRLHHKLRSDWPLSFVQVFEDISGCIVVSFHQKLAAQEGDITAYMNQHHRTDIAVQDFRLVKDTFQWGVLADPDSHFPWGVYFVYWPPWCPRPKVIPPHLAGPRPQAADRIDSKWVGRSGRQPFGQRTDAGLLTHYDTRPLQRSMVFKTSDSRP